MRQGLRVLPCRRLKAWGLSMAVKAQRARVTEEGLRPIPVPPSLPPCPEQRKDGFDFGLKASSKQILRQGLGRRGSHADLLFCEVLTAAPVLFFQKKKKGKIGLLSYPNRSIFHLVLWDSFPSGCFSPMEVAFPTLTVQLALWLPLSSPAPQQQAGPPLSGWGPGSLLL